MKVISTAPTRLSLFGGGTDVEPYASKYGGICINMAINLRQHFILSDDGKDNVYPAGANPLFYEKFLKEFNWKPKTIVSTFDSVIESGIGASASAAVALIGGLSKANNIQLTKNEIAEMAWDIEVNKIKLLGGKQDQYAATYGGINLLIFEDKVYRYSLKAENLLPYLVLFYTGQNRKSSDIQKEFQEPSEEQLKALDEIKEIAYKALDCLDDWQAIGYLLDLTWEQKKKSNSKVTNEKIDAFYDLAKRYGALGGKIMGAGGGGHILFVCEPEKQANLIDVMTLAGASWVDFGIDKNGLEVRII